MNLEPDEVASVRPGEELDWAALERYLREHVERLDGPFAVEQFPNGSANLTSRVSFGDRRLVVRRPPFGEIAPGAHDMRREYTTLASLWQEYPRAPRALAFCDDHGVVGSDFLVVEYRPGVVVWGAVPSTMTQVPDAARRIGFAVVDALADLHVVDPAACGLEGLGKPEGFLERQVGGWRRRWERVGGDAGALAGRIDGIGVHLASTMPVSSRVAVLHNDYKVDNCQFAPDDPDTVVSRRWATRWSTWASCSTIGPTRRTRPTPVRSPHRDSTSSGCRAGRRSWSVMRSARGATSATVPGTRRSRRGRRSSCCSSCTAAGCAGRARIRGWRSAAS